MSALSAFIFLGLGACVLCETCPAVEKIHPCTCKNRYEFYIDIECSDDTMSLEDLKRVLDGLSGKQNIDLIMTGLKLGEVPSKFFNGTEVKNIIFRNCYLLSLADNVHEPAFIGLEDSLEGLNINSGFTKSIVPARLNIAHLRKLWYLELVSNPAFEIKNDDLPASLTSILIWNNDMKLLGDRAFAKLTNLRSLQLLKEDHVGPIQRSMFPFPADKLEDLFLGYLNPSGIPEDLFSNMTALKSLGLRYMGISRIEKNTWEPVLEQLEVISIGGNPLVCDSHMDWMHEYEMTDILDGDCRYPEEKNGTTLWNFLNGEEWWR